MTQRMTKTSVNYKKAVKMLRRSSLTKDSKNMRQGNYYAELHELEEGCVDDSEKVIKEDTTNISLKYLPEDIINIILQYLPYKTRLAIIKFKYHRNYIRSILKKVPPTVKGLNKLWCCADISAQLLNIITDSNSNIFAKFTPHCVSYFKYEKNPEDYSNFYVENFTRIILATLKHYTKIYTNFPRLIKKNFVFYRRMVKGADFHYKVTNECIENHIERYMLHIFAQIAAM
jgi:hypothetical protein